MTGVAGLQVDHLVFAVPELILGVERVQDLLGVRAEIGGRHPQWGTTNALLSLGERCYLEVVAPDPQRDYAELPRLFGLHEVVEPRLVTWAARVPVIEDSVVAAARAGLDLGEVTGGFRQRPDGGMVRWRVSDPLMAREGGVVPFLIAWSDSAHPGDVSPPGCELIDLEAFHPRGEGLAVALSSMGVELEVQDGPAPRLVALIETPQGEVELS